MLEKSLEILKFIENNGYKAYIVGGFVRDYILGISSSDVDICTNATPKQIKDMFEDSYIPNEEYGAITVIYDNVRFEITTFRREYDYLDNRRPARIEYTDSIIEDLQRRDFTINTICMNKNGEVLDFLNNKEDISNKVIKTIGNSDERFAEDALRILRAIRFATVLNFKLDDEVADSIKRQKGLLKNISFNRKKEELNKIFMSKNAIYGINLIKSLGVDKELDIYNLDNIKISNDLIGVWASLEVSDKYPFVKVEKELISKIKEASLYDNLDNKILYKYGPYVNSVCAFNKGIGNTEVIEKYNDLPIKTRSDILITSREIMDILNKTPGDYIKKIYLDLEDKILNGNLRNEKIEIIEYIRNKYLGDLNEKQ